MICVMAELRAALPARLLPCHWAMICVIASALRFSMSRPMPEASPPLASAASSACSVPDSECIAVEREVVNNRFSAMKALSELQSWLCNPACPAAG